VPTPSKELYGLRATLDRLVYFRDPERTEPDAPHAFIYFITIANLSSTTITLNGRRWVIRGEDGHQNVFEGQGIVGKEPILVSPADRSLITATTQRRATVAPTAPFTALTALAIPFMSVSHLLK